MTVTNRSDPRSKAGSSSQKVGLRSIVPKTLHAATYDSSWGSSLAPFANQWGSRLGWACDLLSFFSGTMLFHQVSNAIQSLSLFSSHAVADLHTSIA